jgi:hypothetical protein
VLAPAKSTRSAAPSSSRAGFGRRNGQRGGVRTNFVVRQGRGRGGRAEARRAAERKAAPEGGGRKAGGGASGQWRHWPASAHWQAA